MDFERGLIHLRLADSLGRKRKGRAIVPMTDRARAELLEAKKASMSRYVIEYAQDRVFTIRKAFEGAVERSGLIDVTPHDLRHTAAVWMAESGTPMPEIAEYLGHTDLRITIQTYARYSPDYLKKAAATLNF